MSNTPAFVNSVVGIVVILSIVTIVIVTREHRDHELHRKLIDGYWDASQAFCLRSDVTSAQVYFRDGKVYILIDEGDRVVLNKCVDVEIVPNWFADDSSWTVQFGEPVDPLPQRCEMRIDISRGMMGIFVDDTLYLELFRDNKATTGVV